MSDLIKTKKDRELLAKWNKKLEKYDDCNIENYDSEEPRLKRWDNFHFKKLSPDQYYSRETYYANARALLETGTFKSKLYKAIWEYYSEGMCLRDIAKEIAKHFSRRGAKKAWKKYSKDAIHKIIRKIDKEQMPK